ncbi:unnamed protein product [Acanthosepion pharaonis]|uniref:Uncharacterized protein n=1 Tax=Acanthosepion pharaonis TaxID=158019 RepID=A0A812B5Y3_ACAPH|nr:unnamed protein product [Sepia pharaonis]
MSDETKLSKYLSSSSTISPSCSHLKSLSFTIFVSSLSLSFYRFSHSFSFSRFSLFFTIFLSPFSLIFPIFFLPLFSLTFPASLSFAVFLSPNLSLSLSLSQYSLVSRSCSLSLPPATQFIFLLPLSLIHCLSPVPLSLLLFFPPPFSHFSLFYYLLLFLASISLSLYSSDHSLFFIIFFSFLSLTRLILSFTLLNVFIYMSMHTPSFYYEPISFHSYLSIYLSIYP